MTDAELKIETGSSGAVSALLRKPAQPRACFVFAHGAGAGMTHAFMTAVAAGLAERNFATLRYQFPYMEKGSKRPDPPGIAHAAVRAAVASAAQHCPGLSLIAGGKSFGARMRRPQPRSLALRASPSWASRCIRPASRRSNAPIIWRT